MRRSSRVAREFVRHIPGLHCKQEKGKGEGKMPVSFENDEALVEEVLERAEKEAVEFVDLQLTDVAGGVKSITIPIGQFDDGIRNGVWFDGSSIQGFARIAESDMYLMPDLTTFAILPWEKQPGRITARVICWVFTPEGKPFPGAPRNILARVLNEVEEMGFEYMTGPELEFFLFRSDPTTGEIAPLPHDHGGYFDFSTDLAYDLRKEMCKALQGLGIQVEASHHEVAAGQHEIDFRYDNALRAADNAVTCRFTLKAIAQQHNLHATFMPKPIRGIAGSGMHTHQSLFEIGTGQNAFYDPDSEYGISKLAEHFIAGQIAHARGMCVVLAPLVNSYKRLVSGFEAPVYITWARINRSALIRVPKISPGKPETTRIELRCPDPSCNPYLAFAVMLTAGLEGIEKKMSPPRPVEEDVYLFDEKRLAEYGVVTLPGSLGEAIEEMERDALIAETLGEHAYRSFLEARRMEWDEYRQQVTTWEIKRYLPTF